MKKFIGKCIIKALNWNIDPNLPEELFGKCVVIAAPHTSNWDYPLTVYAMNALGVNLRYTIKKSFMRPPVGWFFKLMGGIAVNRTPKGQGEQRLSIVDAIVNLFNEHDKLAVVMQPEGTRSLREEWKTGFYYVALKAKVPIALGYLDYKKRISGIGKIIHPTGDIEADMYEIMNFYKDIAPKFPEDFSLDKRYYPKKATNEPIENVETPSDN